jgi:hypothetical protein
MKLHLHHFSKIKSKKESPNSRNQGYYYFCMMIEGSGSGSRRPKNMWIRWIRIHNTAFRNVQVLCCFQAGLRIPVTSLRIRIHVQLFTYMWIRIQLFTFMRSGSRSSSKWWDLLPLVSRLSRAHFEPPGLHGERPQLFKVLFEPLNL